MIWILSLSLFLTLLLEIVFGIVWGLRKRNLHLLLLANMLTNPPVVLINHITGLVLLPEVAAIITEGYLYHRLGEKFRFSFLFSFSVNLFSYCFGVLLSMLFSSQSMPPNIRGILCGAGVIVATTILVVKKRILNRKKCFN